MERRSPQTRYWITISLFLCQSIPETCLYIFLLVSSLSTGVCVTLGSHSIGQYGLGHWEYIWSWSSTIDNLSGWEWKGFWGGGEKEETRGQGKYHIL